MSAGVSLGKEIRDINAPRDHHFVPVFYLKQWLGADGRLEEYKIVRGRVVNRRIGPRGTGFQRDLYSFDVLSPERAHFLEAMFLKGTDDLAARAMQKLLSGNSQPWTDELRSAWSRFVYQLLIRHPDPFSEIRAAAERGDWLRASVDSQREFEALRREGMPERLDDFLQQEPEFRDETIMSLLQVVLDNDRVGVRINNLLWTVFNVSASPYPLLTSDWPVENALGAETPFVALPIGPQRLFVGVHDPDVIERLSQRRTADLVRTVNLHTVTRARRYVWGSDKRQTRFIENHMGKEAVSPPFFPTISRAL